MTFSLKLCVVMIFGAAWHATTNSVYLAKLCRGHVCNDPGFPILDYSEEEKACLCRKNPCWDVNGVTHSCDTPEFPFIRFLYNEQRQLRCECSSKPYFSSVHIARDLCPGQRCEDIQYPMLDYDDHGGECVCRAHPCMDIEGTRHECPDMKFPLLVYREDKPEHSDSPPKQHCDCAARLDRRKVDF